MTVDAFLELVAPGEQTFVYVTLDKNGLPIRVKIESLQYELDIQGTHCLDAALVAARRLKGE